ncbi:hypothetical protein FRC19_005561 [Serendipita sp. 401]|nr:hypothetical protein FRC19_005561 [Serendipita sp. 401]KAG9026950.1 hypothetical protein FS842_004968 [Serendipita sp. 407]
MTEADTSPTVIRPAFGVLEAEAEAEECEEEPPVVLEALPLGAWDVDPTDELDPADEVEGGVSPVAAAWNWAS